MAECHFEAIGTVWQIDIYDRLSKPQAQGLEGQIKARIEQFDLDYSRFRSDSLVTKISQTAGRYELPEDAHELLGLYRKLYDVSDGKVTPLIGQILSDAGYDARYSFVSQSLTSPQAWDEVMNYDHPTLHIKKPVLLDFGAAGKGYLVDIIGTLIVEAGFSNFCVDAGGDIYYQSMQPGPLRVGLEDPDDPSRVLGVSEINSGSICGSAGNRRKWGQYHHIIDPTNLTSPRTIKAVWVTAATCAIADAMSTALYFVAPEVLAKPFDFEFLIITEGESLLQSADFPAELFLAGGSE